MKNKKKYKYKVLEYLKKLPYQDYKYARKHLPLVLGISNTTFERWLSIPESSSQQIPADKLAVLAKFCDCSIEDLFNYHIPKISFRKLRQFVNQNLASKFGLTK